MILEKILPNLGKINNLYRNTVKKVSEPFDIPVKKCKIAHYSQSFCPAPHKPTSNLKHPKGKPWHIIFIFKPYKSTQQK